MTVLGALLLLSTTLLACRRAVPAQEASAPPGAKLPGARGNLSQAPVGSSPADDTRPSTVALPADWPLAELTAPPGTRLAQMPCAAPRGYGDQYMIRELPFNVGTKEEGKLWRVGFSYDRGPDICMQHLERCLKPLGYYLYWSEEGRGREFISPDGRYIAQMYYWPEEQVYHLQVSVYKQAWLRNQAVPRNS